MAGQKNRDGIFPVCSTDRAAGGGLSQLFCNVLVGNRLAVRNFSQNRPDSALEGGSLRAEREVKFPALSAEIFFQLLSGLFEQVCFGNFKILWGYRVAEKEVGDKVAFLSNPDFPKRRLVKESVLPKVEKNLWQKRYHRWKCVIKL